MQAKKYKAYLADKSGDLTYFHMSTLTDKIGSAWENDTSKGTRMPFYIQYLSLLNCWHFTEAINIQWTLQDGERRSTKIWQHSPLTRPRERLSAKGSCHGYSKLCCDVPQKRRNLKNRSTVWVASSVKILVIWIWQILGEKRTGIQML